MRSISLTRRIKVPPSPTWPSSRRTSAWSTTGTPVINRYSITVDGSQQMDEETFALFARDYLQIDSSHLVFAHIFFNIMDVTQPGLISKAQFGRILNLSKQSCPQQINQKIPLLQNEILTNPQYYRQMYIKAYKYHSCLSPLLYAQACQLWQIYLKPIMRLYSTFIQFLLEKEGKPKVVHQDLWNMVYQFAVGVDSVEQWNEGEGWPVFIDNFVGFVKKRSFV